MNKFQRSIDKMADAIQSLCSSVECLSNALWNLPEREDLAEYEPHELAEMHLGIIEAESIINDAHNRTGVKNG